MHFLTVFWKVLFAFVPPTEYWNGWACFFVSISLIGVLTAVTGDLASHFGCTIGLKDSVTAVVFVALGTSVPGEDSTPCCHQEFFLTMLKWLPSFRICSFIPFQQSGWEIKEPSESELCQSNLSLPRY